jgi:hypothetical protein
LRGRSAEPLSPLEMMHIADEIGSFHPLIEAMEVRPASPSLHVIFQIDGNAAAHCRTPFAQSKSP